MYLPIDGANSNQGKNPLFVCIASCFKFIGYLSKNISSSLYSRYYGETSGGVRLRGLAPGNSETRKRRSGGKFPIGPARELNLRALAPIATTPLTLTFFVMSRSWLRTGATQFASSHFWLQQHGMSFYAY